MEAGRRKEAWLIAGLLAFYLVLAAVLPAADDEVYYWSWARPLQFSYYDHPPMTAYLIRLSTNIFGDSIFGFRVPACLATLFVAIVIGHLSRPRSLLPGVLLTPLFTLGAVLITPDAPLLCAWAAYVWWLVEVHRRLTPVTGESPDNADGTIPWWLWSLGGVILGCGVLGKYTMALAVPAGFVSFLLVWRLWRKWLAGYILHGVVSFVVASPILIHNIQHDFVPLLFQWRHSMGDSRPGLKPFGEFVGVQLLLFGTLPFFLYPWVVWNFRRLCENPRLRACACLYALPMTFFLYKATQAPLQGNWALVMFVAFWPLAAVWYESVRQSKSWRWATAAAFVLPAACVFVLAVHVVSPLPFIPADVDRVTRQYALNDATRKIAETIRQRGETLPVFTPTYQITAWLRFQSLDGRQIDQISRPSHFTQHPESLTDVNRAYVVAAHPLPEKFADGFGEPELIGDFPVVVRGEPVRDYKLYLYTRPVAARGQKANVALVTHSELSAEPARLAPDQAEPIQPSTPSKPEKLMQIEFLEINTESSTVSAIPDSAYASARDFDAQRDDLKKSGALKVLGSGTLLLLPNQTVRYFSGSEFPVPLPAAVGLITTEMRQVGFEVNVTPDEQPDGQIQVRLMASYSERDMNNAVTINGTVVPGISRRKMQSTVTMSVGEPALTVVYNQPEKQKQFLVRYELMEAP